MAKSKKEAEKVEKVETPKVERFKIYPTSNTNPIKTVEVTEATISKNPDVYFTNKEMAKSEAMHRLNRRRDEMEFELYNDLKLKIIRF